MRIAVYASRPPITALAHRDRLAQFIERGAIIPTDGLEQLGLKREGRLVVPTERAVRGRQHLTYQGLRFRPAFERAQRYSEIKRRSYRGLVVNTCVEIK